MIVAFQVFKCPVYVCNLKKLGVTIRPLALGNESVYCTVKKKIHCDKTVFLFF